MVWPDLIPTYGRHERDIVPCDFSTMMVIRVRRIYFSGLFSRFSPFLNAISAYSDVGRKAG
jgi:hypothetical protein